MYIAKKDNINRKLFLVYFSGSFSVWNLNTKSALLTHRDSSGNLVQLPYVSVQAHTSPVHGIKFCQRIPHYVYTAGADRWVDIFFKEV